MLESHDDKHSRLRVCDSTDTGRVLRNDVLQQHIDAKTRLNRTLSLFLDGAAIIPRGDGVQ